MIPLLLLMAAGLTFDHITDSGIRWRHFNGESPDRYLVETTTGGLAFFDYDGDGLPDLFLVNGGETRRGRSPVPVQHALYKNLGNRRFMDVTAMAAVGRVNGYGMGATSCDFDNDGLADLYVTGFPKSTLYRNLGGGKFKDVTQVAGVENNGRWGASAACLDFDKDGLLDLFVANYAEFSYDDPKKCDFAGEPTYCAQTAYKGQAPRLYRNMGGWFFEDVSAKAAVSKLVGRALGVVAVDVNDDGNTDLFVARDASPNLLLLNSGKGTFQDAGLEAEVAYNEDGVARAGMGVDAGDVDGDGRPDFIVTNFDTEYHALFLNTGRFPWREATVVSGLAMHSKPFVGWGVRLVDFDNDGDLDAVIANGHLHSAIEKSNKSVRYREPPLLLLNDGKGKFTNGSASAGPAFSRSYLGRGLATADIDNDGAVDVAFIDLNSRPVLLSNRLATGSHWLGLRLEGTVSNRDAIGARVTLQQGDKIQNRWVTGGGSILASHDRRVHFGLGATTAPVRLTIIWPSGLKQQITDLAFDKYHTIREPKP
ncbi:MAG: CRTAC1 family protein [Bryobacterales bacterium]|nr:CRTAC1 family protein [Bryobacterales bacterium]